MKQCTITSWKYQDRPMAYEVYNHAPKALLFSGGIHLPIDKEKYGLRAVSKAQKALRQDLYQYLLDNRLNSLNYIINIDAPLKPTGQKAYFELKLMFEPADVDDSDSNKRLCDSYFVKMGQQLENFIFAK